MKYAASITIADVGIITIHTDGIPDADGRLHYRCTIFATYDGSIPGFDGRTIYRGDGVRSGVDERLNLTGALATTLTFITDDGEKYRRCMGAWVGIDDDSQPSFDKVVAEWAYMNSEELQAIELELRGETP